MTGITIFVVGGMFLANIAMVALLVADSNKKKKGSPEKPIIKDEEPESDSESTKSIVGKSKFNVHDFEKKVIESVAITVKEVLPVVLEDMLGEVQIKNVQFSEESDEESGKEKHPPLSPEETELAFNTDIRDFDEEPAAPSAQGTSLDDLESAVDTAMDFNSTPEQKTEAGKKLSELKGTVLYDRISENDEISRRIDLCIRMSIQADIKKSDSNRKIPPKVKKAVVSIPDDFESFNPADLLK